MKTTSLAVTVTANYIAYNVCFMLQTVVWHSHGQHKYLLIYNYTLKTAFDAYQRVGQTLLCG